MKYHQAVKDLRKLSDPQKAQVLAGFFKTGKGEYGEGDIFWGISVPSQRIIAEKYSKLDLQGILMLLRSKIHEQRLTALLILVDKYQHADLINQKAIFDLYLSNTKYINNWDLVDLSAPEIVGDYLKDKDSVLLNKLARSKSLWDKRIAVLATFAFIKRNDFRKSLYLAELFLAEQHDLMHKAVGWMLREVGKKDRKVLEDFLNKYAHKMPRTMLRYAIEKFDEKTRLYFLKK